MRGIWKTEEGMGLERTTTPMAPTILDNGDVIAKRVQECSGSKIASSFRVTGIQKGSKAPAK